MAEDEKKSDLINSAANLAKAIPIYDDALQPVMQETGKALSTAGKAVNVALAPIRGLVWGGEKIEEWIATKVANKFENVPEEEIVTPDPAIAGPTIEALKYNGHKAELSEMFANLLANSMKKNTQKEVHPSYVGIISSMSSLDAQIFAAVIALPAIPTIEIMREVPNVEGKSRVVSHFHSDLHAISVRLLGSGTGSLEAMQTSVEQLVRLGLINAVSDGYLTSQENISKYSELESCEVVSAFKRRERPKEISYSTKRSYLMPTQIGKSFQATVLN